jgi:phosphatidate phosphatase APP1
MQAHMMYSLGFRHFRLMGVALTLFSSLGYAPRSHALSVVSDIDDTIKISHVNTVFTAIFNAPFDHAFTGMSETYQAISASGAVNNFYYISGSPILLTHHLTGFLAENRFPQGKLVLREQSDPKDMGLYKEKQIRALLNEIQDSVILIGDDTQEDGKAYAQMSLEFPGRVKGIYIHRITGIPMS